jgi:HAD superfamily hydrolase (TIGR01509 family)
MTAILFGSISTLADTSELQRQAFNEAFQAHGLDWRWDRDDYTPLLEKSGGKERIAEYARSVGEDVDVDAIHQTKSEIFQNTLATSELTPRPGVVDTMEAARRDGVKLALVTSTSETNVESLLAGLRSSVDRHAFETVLSAAEVEQPKPDRAVYDVALDRLGESAEDCVAIEDNLGGVQSATAAGLHVVAFPNENTADHSFEHATSRVERLEFEELRSVIGQR